jgi:hypothetical protein
MHDILDIQPASLTQFQRARNGKLIGITEDVGNVAQSLRDIDRALRLAYSPDQDISIVSHQDGDTERLVTTMQGTPDQRLVRRVREIASEGYDFAKELEKTEQANRKVRQDEFRERVGEVGERLAHALRKDLHAENRVFLNRGLRP